MQITQSIAPFLGLPLNQNTIALIESAIGGNISTTTEGTRASVTVNPTEAPILTSANPPDTSALAPNESALLLMKFAIAPFLGKRGLKGVERAIMLAIGSDPRLILSSVSVVGNTVVADISLVESPQFAYDGTSTYNGTLPYG